MPAARAASAREPPSSTRASASMRRAARASRHRPASRRSSTPPSSFRVTATVMAPSVDRLHRRSTPAGRAWRHGPNGQKPRPLVLDRGRPLTNDGSCGTQPADESVIDHRPIRRPRHPSRTEDLRRMRPGLNTTLSASRLAVMRTGKTARFCQRNLSGPKARALLAALGCPISRRRWLASRAEVTDRRGGQEGKRMAKEIFCAFGVDVDAVAGWLGSYGGEDSPCDITRGLFAGEVGRMRLLRPFERFGIKTTRFVPGHSAETFPEQMRAVADAGHEIGMYGYSHEEGFNRA